MMKYCIRQIRLMILFETIDTANQLLKPYNLYCKLSKHNSCIVYDKEDNKKIFKISQYQTNI